MCDQLPNPIQFIINHISLWPAEKIDRPYHTNLYQEYLAWCENNGEKPFANSILGKKFSLIGIDRVRLQSGGKRDYHYILDRSKIIAKFRESSLGDIEEFSDTSQADLPANETTDIPIFNVPETVLEGLTISLKIISPQPEKNASLSSNKKADKQDDSTQTLFDYVAEQAEAPVTSTSGTSEISKTSELSEPLIDKSEASKPSESIELSNKEASFTFLARQQREDRLRKRAVEFEEDLDVFVIITEKDRLDSIAF